MCLIFQIKSIKGDQGFVNIHEASPPPWAFLDTKSIKDFSKPQEVVQLFFL